MSIFLKIGVWLGVLASVVVALFAIVFALAAGANSTPAQIEGVWRVVWGCALLALFAPVGALSLLKASRLALALIVSLLPIPLMIALVLWQLQ
ncbi:MAG: hypothetical protein ABL957_05510 [Parvularculaceae bacterium]